MPYLSGVKTHRVVLVEATITRLQRLQYNGYKTVTSNGYNTNSVPLLLPSLPSIFPLGKLWKADVT